MMEKYSPCLVKLCTTWSGHGDQESVPMRPSLHVRPILHYVLGLHFGKVFKKKRKWLAF